MQQDIIQISILKQNNWDIVTEILRIENRGECFEITVKGLFKNFDGQE